MRGEAAEETATGRAELCVTSDRKPPSHTHVLARGDKVDPKTLAVNKGQLITSQPGDKDTLIFLPATLSALFHIQLPLASTPSAFPLLSELPKI